MWTLLSNWEQKEDQISTVPFYDLSIGEILDLIDEASVFFDDIRKEYKDLSENMVEPLRRMT
jgi:hypothetical protein